jgi:hypothetical protein
LKWAAESLRINRAGDGDWDNVVNTMSFIQAPPVLGNTFENDVVLRAFLANHLPAVAW